MRSALAALVLISAILADGCATSRHEPPPESCPVCHKPVADGPEVRLVRSGDLEPGTRYRCFVCPLLQRETGSSWTLRAASGVDGRRVTFRVDGGRVVADPPTAVVLALKVEPGAECLDVRRVFVDEDEFRRYVKAHPAMSETIPRRFEDVLAEYRR